MKKSTEKKEKKSFWKSKNVSTILNGLTTPFAIGLYVTAIYVFGAMTFYQVRSQNEAGINQGKLSSYIFRGVEALDFLLTDWRFNFRGEKSQTDSQVALVAIDDESLEIVGRWPWSRDLMAQLIESLMKNGVKAVGLDIIWSEPQENSSKETLTRLESRIANPSAEVRSLIEQEKSRPQPDDVLAETVKKYQDKVVLGVFPTDETHQSFAPYTDYCRNEAFNRINGSQFVKADNITLVVEDTADTFEPVKFSLLFEPIFGALETATTNSFLQKLNKKTPDELGSYERNRLRIQVNNAISGYCDKWLVVDEKNKDNTDPFLDDWLKFFGGLTTPEEALKKKMVTAKFDALAGLSPLDAAKAFKWFSLSHPVPQHRGWTINIEKLHQAANFSASFAAEQDNDGKIRSNPMFFRTGNRIGSSFVPSLALQTYLVANPGYQAQVEIAVDPKNPRQKIIRTFKIGDVNKPEKEQEVMRVPVDGQGRLKINYAGPQRMYAHISAKDLLNDSPEMRLSQRDLEGVDDKGKPLSIVNKAAFLKDKIILIGATAVGIYDLRVTPFDKNFPGPETHITVLDNLVRKNFIRVDPAESRTMIWALALLGTLLALAIGHSGPFLGFFVVFAASGALIILDQVLLRQGLVTTMALPGLQVVSIYTLIVLYKYFTEERKKKELRKTFSKYVSPAIVDEILKSPDNIELGGKKQRMSVFFSDVRGFTKFSEKLDPQDLSDVLTRYLTPMTQIVFANKGTLDKYMGDALMAFFGAPISYPDHAKYACRTALASMEKLKEIQADFKAKNLPHIDIGIGINTSDMSVGNMGSDIVRSYTVMGDGVNLASRLEGINKEYGTRIIISEFTYGDIKNDFTVREVDWVQVKGKNKPVRIFELISEGKPENSVGECLGLFQEGFDLYHKKEFTVALKKFEQALKAHPGDPPSELYVARCQEYLAEAPPENWDGVHVMKTK